VADLDLVGSVRGGQLADAAANITVRNASIRGLGVRTAVARVLVSDGQITVPALTLDSSAGAARIDGRATPDGRLDLRVIASGVDAGQIARALGGNSGGMGAVRGIVYAAGRITGTVQDPRLRARVRVLRPGFGNYRADLVRGDVLATRQQIVLGPPGGGDPVTVRRLPTAAITVQGTITLPRGNQKRAAPALNLQARLAQPVEISELVRIAQQQAAPPSPRGASLNQSSCMTGA
jgi:hypothetical protein